MDTSAHGDARAFALFLAAAVIAGAGTALAGNLFGARAVYYVAVFGTIGAGTFVAATRDDPLRFVFLALILAFPVASALVPPGRFGLTVFDVVMLVLTLGVIGRNIASTTNRLPLLPTRSLAIAWALCLPCVAFSQFPAISAAIIALMFALYGFFLLCLAELRRERGFERLVMLLCGVLIVMALGLVIDHILHMNLSLRGSNLNQLTYEGGIEVYRAGGFFQDPQRCGAFFASLIAFMLVLAVRGRFVEPALRGLLWFTIAAGLAALPMTIARSAILSCLFVSAIVLFAFNAWSWHLKAAIVAALIVAMTLIVQTPLDLWLGLMPETLGNRFRLMPAELENRITIWFDTWNMFADHPVTGIGFGSFQPYLLHTRPGVFNYYDIGTTAGVGYVPDQPESGYLKILYEGGVAGSAAALLLAGDAVRRALGGAAGATAEARTECIAALAGLVTFGATFTTSFTVNDPRVGGLLAFLLAVVWGRSLTRKRPVRAA